MRPDGDLGVLGRLVGGADAGEVGDLAGAGLLVEPLRVALLGDLERDVGEDLDEGDRLIAGGRGGAVQVARDLPVRLEGRDERRDGDGGRVGEELGDLDGGGGGKCRGARDIR